MYASLDDALRSLWDYDDFVKGFQLSFVKSDEEGVFYKTLIEKNPDMTSDELIIIALERKRESGKADHNIMP